jgi:hypothetical protein
VRLTESVNAAAALESASQVGRNRGRTLHSRAFSHNVASCTEAGPWHVRVILNGIGVKELGIGANTVIFSAMNTVDGARDMSIE